jgi:predicted nucleic acid-binding protein
MSGRIAVAEMIVIDTDVLIDAGRGVREAIVSLEELSSQMQLAVSTVTPMELIVGCRQKSDLRAVDRFLTRFEIIALNPQVSDMAVDFLRRYRLSHGLLVADALIAATAAWLHRPLMSKNWRDYRFIEAIELIKYPRPSRA